MYKRFFFICIVLAAAIAALTALGVKALRMQEQGLRAERQGQFVAVAEQIRLDVKQKLDAFIKAEQNRPYTDYQSYYVPQSANQMPALVKSPLGGSLEQGLAFGHFQLDDQRQITLPYIARQTNQEAGDFGFKQGAQEDKLSFGLPAGGVQKTNQPQQTQSYLYSLEKELMPVLEGQAAARQINVSDEKKKRKAVEEPAIIAYEKRSPAAVSQTRTAAPASKSEQADKKVVASQRSARYKIASLEEENQQVQMLQQPRENVLMNTEQMSAPPTNTEPPQNKPDSTDMFGRDLSYPQQMMAGAAGTEAIGGQAGQTVQIRIEPFAPVVIASDKDSGDIFPGRVLLLRHVQIEEKHLVQGFELNQKELVGQTEDSARRFVRKGMGFDISAVEKADAAYTAVLDFGFGELALNLLELDPGWIMRKTAELHNWFWAIVAVSLLAVFLAMAGLWKNLHQQLALSRKKDDFISAVSHELRTPLTSIRMYTEMLEKDWVASEDKRKEYYTSMRQETERLSRLIENVLDFSRIQRDKKHYHFVIGDLNECLESIVKMMRPCAEREGFALKTDFEKIEAFAFDRDAVMQIAVNLIDNAVKYAHPAQNKVIIVRTRRRKDLAVLEVEDHGPGIPRSQQAKIFEAFYRCGDESTRQTTGTGLGLALVKRFAQAHRGFVEVLNLKPGAVFRVGLATA